MSGHTRLSAVETAGGADSVVLLHGFGGSAAAWQKVQEAISPEYATLALDLPGHAGSLDYEGFGNAAFAAKAVINEMDRREIAAFHLAGHSMGGAVAALAAIRHPHRVLSLTLLAPGGLGPEINAALLRSFAAAQTPAELQSCLEVMFAPATAVPEELIAAQAAQRQLPGQIDALKHIASTILAGDGQGVIDRARLDALAMPVSVLWGKEDRMMPLEQLENAPEKFHRTALAAVGHMLVDEAPETVARFIVQTIRRAA